MIWLAELALPGSLSLDLGAGSSLLGEGFGFAIREATTSGVAICGALFVLSCFSWAVMVSKMCVLAKVRRRSRKFIAHFRRSPSPFAVDCDNPAFQGSPFFAVYLAGSREMALHLVGSPELGERTADRLEGAPPVSPEQMDGVEGAMGRAVGESALGLESSMTLLATAVSGAPFLGLLGTVWGVMDTFGGVAVAEGAASLKTMAPGVSAALVTTVVGLLVAIPAMFGYNFLVNSIRRTTAELDNFSAELSARFRRRYVAFAGGTPGERAGVLSRDAGAAATAPTQDPRVPGPGGGEDGYPTQEVPGLGAPAPTT